MIEPFSVYEIVDNSIDEALAGHCSTINVTIYEDNSISVEDDGRGIPSGMNEKLGLPTLEVVYTVLHAGGKFGGEGYKIAGGLHGVGASVVNALSEWVEVENCRDGKKYTEIFERGHVARPFKEEGETDCHGLYDRFLADFSGISIAPTYQICLSDRLPIDQNDRPVQVLITEKGVEPLHG